MKIKTMRLSFPHAPEFPSQCQTAGQWEAARRYRIEQVTDSTLYNPGDYLDRETVKAVCDNADDWKITIVPVKD